MKEFLKIFGYEAMCVAAGLTLFAISALLLVGFAVTGFGVL